MDGCDTGALDPPLVPPPQPRPHPPSPRLPPGLTDRPVVQQPRQQMLRHQAGRNYNAVQLDSSANRPAAEVHSRNDNAVQLHCGSRPASGRGSKGGKRKRRTVELVVPESQQQDDREDWPAGPHAQPDCQNRQQSDDPGTSDQEQQGLGRSVPRHGQQPHALRHKPRHDQKKAKIRYASGSLKKGQRRSADGGTELSNQDFDGRGGAGVIEDSVEDDDSLLCSPDMDDVSSADAAQQALSGHSGQRQSAAAQVNAANAEVGLRLVNDNMLVTFLAAVAYSLPWLCVHEMVCCLHAMPLSLTWLLAYHLPPADYLPLAYVLLYMRVQWLYKQECCADGQVFNACLFVNMLCCNLGLTCLCVPRQDNS